MFSTLNKTYQRLIYFVCGLLATVILSLITSNLAIAQATVRLEVQSSPVVSQVTATHRTALSSSAFQEVAASHLEPNFYP